MNCDLETLWEIEFQGVPGQDGDFRIRPLSLTFERNRGAFDFAEAKLPPEVGEVMKKHTGEPGGYLRHPVPVKIFRGGEKVITLYFKPDFANYDSQYTWLEFHDLQKALDTGVCDKHWNSVTLREAYKYAFKKSNNKHLLTDLKFAVPEELETTLVGQTNFAYDDSWGFRFKELDSIRPWMNRNSLASFDEYKQIEQDKTKKIVDSFYGIDFDKISPLKAIFKLNEKFNVQSWVDKDGVLWIGYPEAQSTMHIAAPNDSRVWRYNSEEISIAHPREPVKRVLVEGNFVDEPGMGTADDIASWFNPNDERGFGDVRATGVAERKDIDEGETLVYKNKDAKRDGLPEIAGATLRELTRDGNSGTVQIDTENSAQKASIAQAQPGEMLHVVPEDDQFNQEEITKSSGILGDEPDSELRCGSFINNELYVIRGISHSIDGSFWSVNIDLQLFIDFDVSTDLLYHDAESDEYLTEEQVYDGGILESDAEENLGI